MFLLIDCLNALINIIQVKRKNINDFLFYSKTNRLKYKQLTCKIYKKIISAYLCFDTKVFTICLFTLRIHGHVQVVNLSFVDVSFFIKKASAAEEHTPQAKFK